MGVLAACLGPGLACSGDRSEATPSPAQAESGRQRGVLDRDIRVLLADEVTSVRLAVDGRADIVDAFTGDVLAAGVRISRPVRVGFAGGRIELASIAPGVDVPAVDVVPREGRTIGVTLPGEEQSRRYRGRLRLLGGDGGTGTVLNVLDIEEYLVGVVSAELYQNFHKEAFRAQAIAARTYAWYIKRTQGFDRDWDVTATESSQMYADLERQALVPAAEQAVRDTRGIVCTWHAPEGERIFCTYYSSTCGGSTLPAGPVKRTATIPPLAGNVSCDYCRPSPTYRWDPVRISKDLVTRRLRERYPKFAEIGRIERVIVSERSESGRPLIVELMDGRGRSIALEAENFRLSVDPTGRELKSTFFRPISDGASFVFVDGRGFGHGLGLCQYGAEGMAQAGASAVEILRFYYPDSSLARAY